MQFVVIYGCNWYNTSISQVPLKSFKSLIYGITKVLLVQKSGFSSRPCQCSLLSWTLLCLFGVCYFFFFFLNFKKIQRFIISFKMYVENETPAVHSYLSSRLLRGWTAYRSLQYYNRWKGLSYWVPGLARETGIALATMLGGIAFDWPNHQPTHGFCLRDTQLLPSRTDSRTNLVCMLCSWSGKRDPGVNQ